MVTATIVLLYISYAVPIFSLVFVRGRNNIRHGPFWLGKVGLVANMVVLFWTVFTLVMYSFPYTMPVQAGNMNYVSAVYAAVSIIVATDWFLRGKKHYGHDEQKRSSIVAEVVERRGSAGHGNVVY